MTDGVKAGSLLLFMIGLARFGFLGETSKTVPVQVSKLNLTGGAGMSCLKLDASVAANK